MCVRVCVYTGRKQEEFKSSNEREIAKRLSSNRTYIPDWTTSGKKCKYQSLQEQDNWGNLSKSYV